MFLSSLLIGCSSLSSQKEVWPKPQHPKLLSVHVVPVKEAKINGGYYLNEINASNLVTNVEEMRYYILKIELLLNKISGVYNIKYEDYK